MPFLKHNDPSTQVADANDTSHKCLWVALPNAELNKQLRTCTQAFAEWVGVDPGMGFKYRDMAAWTAEVAGIAEDLDRRSYLQWYFGMQDAPGGLEEPFLLAFAHVEKRAYASEALFVTALVAGAAKADRSRLEAAALSDGGLHACQASRAADPKEKAITFGMLRGTGAGGRMVAWLERAITERNDAGNKPVLVALRQAAVRRGRVDAGETDVEMFAYAAVHELAESVLTPPAFYVYHTDPKARLLDALARIRDAPDQFDGASRFCQAHTPGLLAVCAPVVADVLHGLTDVRALNSQLLELASVFPKGQVPTKPAELFTVHGMRALGRLAAAYAVWAADAKTTVASVDTRADSFINRIRLNSAAGYEPSGGAGGGAGAAADSGGAAAGVGGTTLRASGEAWRAALTRVRELGANPAIVRDLLKLVAKPGHDPLDMLDVALTGATTACPERESTALSRMLGTGKINAAALDARLAPLYEYSSTQGGRYLGRAVAETLTEQGLADAEAVADLRFDALWAVMAGQRDSKSWGTTLDFYNLLVVELVRQVQCEGALFDIAVAAVPQERVYMDPLINGRLPILCGAVFEAMGLPHDGPTSFRGVLDASNSFVSFNGGVTSESTQGARGVITPPRPRTPAAACLPHRASPQPRHSPGTHPARRDSLLSTAHGTLPPLPQHPALRCHGARPRAPLFTGTWA